LREVVEALLGKGACAVPRAGRRSLDRILEDRASGCLALARRSASLLARSGNEPVPPETLARLLSLGRPSFFGIANACADAVAARARGGAKAARGVASGLAGARLRAAERAARGLTGRRVIVTSSASGTVEEALALWMRERSALEVRVLESRPPSEGAKLAARLAARGGPRVVLYPDAAMESAVSGADAVLLGADAVFRDGGIANKTGSLPLARSARARGVPVFVVAESVKRARSAAQEALWLAEDGPAGEYRPPLPRRGAARVVLENPSFERVPARLISALWGDRRDGSC
jgi:translation initiation factor 2B subunit (eIF-2B alpha/beta/delta family)